MGTGEIEAGHLLGSFIRARRLSSVAVVVLAATLAAGCASESEGPAPFGTGSGGTKSPNQQPGETPEPASEETFDAEPGGDIEEIPTTAKSVEEWEQLEEIEGDEYVALFGDPDATGGGLQQQSFVGSLGKMFKGVDFSIGKMPAAPKGFLKVGTFLPKAGETLSGSLFADRLPFGLASMLEPVASLLVTAIKIQGSLAKAKSLPAVDAKQGARLARLYGGVAPNYRIATPAPFLFESSAVSSLRIFINAAGAKPKAVEFTQITKHKNKTTRLQVPAR